MHGSHRESALALDQIQAGLLIPRHAIEQFEVRGFFHAVLSRNGEMVWEDEFANLVMSVGKIDMLDKYWAASAYTAAFYMGLLNTGAAFNAADTMASHAGWTEVTAYVAATRVAVAWNAASASGGGAGSAGIGSKVSTATSFSINAGVTIAGCFMTTISTKSGTTGTLISAGAFTGGDRIAVNGDTLNVTYTSQN